MLFNSNKFYFCVTENFSFKILLKKSIDRNRELKFSNYYHLNEFLSTFLGKNREISNLGKFFEKQKNQIRCNFECLSIIFNQSIIKFKVSRDRLMEIDAVSFAN